ncbi:MAG: hypothetical protein ACKOA9_13970 [Actinomycetota bacterium]
MDPNRRLVALWYCRGRALVGVTLVLFPRLATRLGLGRPSPVGNATMRMVGVRDLAVGLGGVAGVREGTQAPEWVGWGAAADAVDALALLATPGLPKRARLVGLFAAAAAVTGLRLAWDLADARADAQADARHAARVVAEGASEPARDAGAGA